MRAHAANARAVADVLRDQEDVADVRWPGFSGMVSFRHPGAVAFAEATELFTLAESLGGVESLVEVPQAMTHQSVEDSDAAVPADLVRLSVGIEAVEDLLEDVERGLAAARVPQAAGARA
jgi:cystathionine gamma-synthase